MLNLTPGPDGVYVIAPRTLDAYQRKIAEAFAPEWLAREDARGEQPTEREIATAPGMVLPGGSLRVRSGSGLTNGPPCRK